jgi:methylphosphotriester-DNA--protein-cysteine methyltransferase
MAKNWRLVGPDGASYESACPGTLGGHRRTRVYGRLDCAAARRAIARGGYRVNRVFFLDDAIATSAGYRPCAVCMAEAYARWRRERSVR